MEERREKRREKRKRMLNVNLLNCQIMKNILGQEIQLLGKCIYTFDNEINCNLLKVDEFITKKMAKQEFKRISVKEPIRKIIHHRATIHYSQLIIG